MVDNELQWSPHSDNIVLKSPLLVDSINIHMSNTHGGQIDDEYSQFLVDQIAVMVKKEVDFYSRADYLGELIESKGDSIDECWRQKVAEWMFKVIDYYVSNKVFVIIA